MKMDERIGNRLLARAAQLAGVTGRGRLVGCAILLIAFQRGPAQEIPTFKAEAKLVVVNVAVKDKSGKPVTTLRKQDFELLEDGKAQEISAFELQTLSNELLPPAADAAAAAPRTLVERVVPKPNAGPDPVTRHPNRRLLALFFDMSSMPQFDQIRAQEQATRFIKEQMTASDLVSLMTFANKLSVVENFTDDRELLLSDIKNLRLGDASELADVAATGGDDSDTSGAFVADDTEFNIFNTDRKLAAIEDAIRKLAVYPEKKSLIYFSSGVSKTGIENQSQLKATENAAIRANVSIYSVDARGLQASNPAGDASSTATNSTGVFTGATQQARQQSFNDSQETLTTLAADTGGKALLDNNDLAAGIRQAQSDVSSYYILGYYSTNAAEDGKYRRIQIKLTNSQMTAQTKLDYRNGYYASKTFQKFTAADKEQQLQEALELGDPVSELPLALEVDYFRVAKDRYFLPISVKIPGSVVALAKKGGKETTDFDFIGELRDLNGRAAGAVRDNITVKLSEAIAASLDHRNLQYDAGLTVGPGVYTLRFLARENQTGKMGTFETRVLVPDLGKSKDMRVSSVVWSSQKEAVAAAVGTVNNDKKSLESHPLISNGQKTVPSITNVFRKEQTLYVYFEVYDPTVDADRKLPNLSARLELVAGAKKVFQSAPVRQTALVANRPGVASFSFTVPLAEIPAGQFVAQVDVIDQMGKKFAFPRGEIVVLQ
jgi:VWFA-related protein